jgi:hypothetical protein
MASGNTLPRCSLRRHSRARLVLGGTSPLPSSAASPPFPRPAPDPARVFSLGGVDWSLPGTVPVFSGVSAALQERFPKLTQAGIGPRPVFAPRRDAASSSPRRQATQDHCMQRSKTPCLRPAPRPRFLWAQTTDLGPNCAWDLPVPGRRKVAPSARPTKRQPPRRASVGKGVADYAVPLNRCHHPVDHPFWPDLQLAHVLGSPRPRPRPDCPAGDGENGPALHARAEGPSRSLGTLTLGPGRCFPLFSARKSGWGPFRQEAQRGILNSGVRARLQDADGTTGEETESCPQ